MQIKFLLKSVFPKSVFPKAVFRKGRFIELEAIYDMTDSWKISSAINFIEGNRQEGINYPFNPMEDFSHFRLEFIYSF